MDLSKLPRLSETPPTPPPQPPTDAEQHQPPPPIDYGRYDRAPMAAEVWISAIIGLIFLMLGWSFAKYCAALLTGREYHTGVQWVAGEKAGTEVAYHELQGYVIWNDSAMFLFGLALLLEAAVLLAIALNWRAQRPLTIIGFVAALLATVYNMMVAGIFLKSGTLPLFSLLAVAFGGFITLYLWRLLPRRYDVPVR